MTRAALLCQNGQKVLFISETSHNQVSDDGVTLITPFDDYFHDFSVFFVKYHDFNGFVRNVKTPP